MYFFRTCNKNRKLATLSEMFVRKKSPEPKPSSNFTGGISPSSFYGLTPPETFSGSAMSKALMNPLIFDIISSHLDVPDLKNFRLVCHKGADVSLNALGKRTRLRVTQLYRYDGSNLYQANHVNDQLCRRLVVSDKSDEFHHHVPDNKMVAVIVKVITDVSPITRDIEFRLSEEKFVTAFLIGMRLLMSNNIRHISVMLDCWFPDKVPAQMRRKLPVQAGLTSLKLHYRGQCFLDEDNLEQCIVFQNLIDSAPNLTFLDFAAPFYPNLEGCKNLQILKFHATHCNHTARLDLVAVSEMLTQVKDSLIRMEFRKSCDTEVSDMTQNPFVPPVMSNLVSLTLHGWTGDLLPPIFDKEYLGQLPKLRNLSVTSITGSTLDLK
ncbi:uncharacterized protein LOC110857386 [Folsomia candida]|uniref:uncharacterized protein LOC110857386 n=1 Tax=Folsomia candida TaxID=158441 RepID=UPI0016050DB9|nr:uncharacterized protein LOC110857386 [Folsomia candida]